jgi:hypothetical protein
MATEKGCDFCSTRPVVARHKVDRRGVAPWEDRSVGDWFACSTCHRLILAGDADAVAFEAATIWIAKHGGDIGVEFARFSNIQEMFWACDAGEYEMLAQ